jgi:hypothetical protein
MKTTRIEISSWRIGIVVVACAWAAGCASSQTAPSGHAPVDPASIEVVQDAATARPHKVIGTVRALGSMSDEDALNLLKKRAAKMGGDAILQPHQTGSGAVGGAGGMSAGMGHTNPDWQAEVLVWTDTPAAAPPAAPKSPPR